MPLVERFLLQRRLILALAVCLALLGAIAALTMPRREDPALPDYWGLVVVRFPGADAEKVERLVVDPVEEHLAEVDEVKTVESTIRSGVVVMVVQLRNPLDDVDEAWDEVRRSLEDARREFPESAGEPILDRELQDTESVVVAISGLADLTALADEAEAIKKELLSVPGTARVLLIGDPGEQITIELDDAVAQRLGLDARMLARQLAARNLTIPGGSLSLGGKTVVLRLNDEFETVDEIARTQILLPSGASLPLGEPAKVRRGPEEPATSRMRFNGEYVVGLGIIPRQRIDVTSFGSRVREKLDEVRKLRPNVRIEEVTFQPDRVRARLKDLGRSLLMSICIVAVILVVFMGLRLGLLVASIVPLVALASLAVYHWGGGMLQQISIAAFVIALGMLVDNAIVVAESVQSRVDAGVDRGCAAADAVRDLALPLAAATGTTLAAFIPMLLAKSVTGDFTRSLPVVIMITLSMSYLFAISVTPALGGALLTPRESGNAPAVPRVSGFLSNIALTKTRWVLAAAASLTIASCLAFARVEQRFFPSSDRNQFVIDVRLPEGAHLEATERAAIRVESALSERPDVESVACFIGRGAPHFYYNLLRQPNSPHLAQLVVNTVDFRSVESELTWVRNFAARELPHAEVVPRRLEQGPPVDAPVEVRITGWDLRDVDRVADRVLANLRRIPEAVNSRHDLSLGIPTIRFAIDDASAARHGLSRSDVAEAVRGRTRGIHVGSFRGGEDPVPILIRSSEGEEFEPHNLSSIHVSPPGGAPAPLAQIAVSEVQWLSAVIHHRNRKRVVTVFAQLREGATYSEVYAKLDPKLADPELPPGVTIEKGGAAEESKDANTAMFQAVPLGLVVLIVILTAEFNSFRRVGIILTTVPLAAVGVVPGLLIAGQPFGFMSLLGVFALVGVVVNNAIVLVDLIDRKRDEGASAANAIAGAVAGRTRPILLTAATTVCGLLPLALSDSNLWPPLAWAMISGLIASTGLTLIVVPALYRTLFPERAAPLA